MSDNHRKRNGASAHRGGPAMLPVLFSLVVPGSGQFLLGARGRGVGCFITVVTLGALILWKGSVALLAPLVGLWLWGAWDAYHLAAGRRGGLGAPLLLAALIVYGVGFKVTEIRPARLATGLPGVMPYFRALTQPELMTQRTEDVQGRVPFQVPCVEPLPPPAGSPSSQPVLTANVPCASIGDLIEIQGEGFIPNFEGVLWWQNPIGDLQQVIQDGVRVKFLTDGEGRFRATIAVPLAVPLTSMPKEGETQTHAILAEQHKPYGGLVPTQTLSLVLEKIGETVAMAFIATVLGMLFAIPVSFLAARNLMSGNRITRIVYFVVRALLNIVRSIETLMWAIVFVVWVGVGPFGGMLALLLHTIAALGKLYSEAIESIDPGPIEALRATGANGLQVIVYAVLPQIVPTFLSFTLYRWDINVRMSTVIGLISDAGLGFLLIQWIRLNNLRAMATSIIAIVLVVAILDYTSAWLRERVITGTPVAQRASPLRRTVTVGVVSIVLAVAFIWSWSVAKINLVDLVEGVPEGLRMLGDFAVPNVLTQPTVEHSVSATLPVPCGSGEPSPAQVAGPRLNLSLSCGDVGEPLTIRGHELPPNANVSVRWVLSDGAFLRVRENCCTTDGSGSLTLETKVSPLMEVDEATGRTAPGKVEIVWREAVGGLQLSSDFKQVVDLSLITLLMALLATTLGSFFAIPLSFFAARNITGRSPLGQAVYYAFRTIFNLWRSVEPMILAVICAAWVGLGPFAGVLALALNNIPNLGKLFSETIEEIDAGPVEAVTATGANRLQILVYAIVPQLVPKFLAFILYQWDINIRMSTVIGYVGGGGIGQFFRQNVQLNQYGAAGMAVWAIVIMVWSMDYVSARAREKLT
ncbi:MAG: phosphonate ABC transporter, permease protein PhnE [Anaerolineae bacterium]|nr:phosphonate ABC transporter, permease protein PhnE [Anaerolineae bacterium]